MTTELPIACTLSATDLPRRQAEMADLGRAALIDVHREGGRADLRFAAAEGIFGRLEALVEAESQCCAFLTLRVSAEPDAVVLTVVAPGDAEPVLGEWVESFGPASQVAR